MKYHIFNDFSFYLIQICQTCTSYAVPERPKSVICLEISKTACDSLEEGGEGATTSPHPTPQHHPNPK